MEPAEELPSVEEQPLLTRTEPIVLTSQPTPFCKTLCGICILFIVATALVASLNESKEHLNGHHDESKDKLENSSSHHQQASGTELTVLVLKCIFLALGISAYLYLVCVVVLEKTIDQAAIVHPYQPHRMIKLGPVNWCFKMGHHLANYPTAFFKLIFISFSLLGQLCVIFQCVERVLEVDSIGLKMFAEATLCVLVATFIMIQLWFFLMHSKLCLQSRLDAAWLSFSVILSANLSCWCFHTALEIREVFEIKQSDWCGKNQPATLKQWFQTLGQSFSPFLSECFLMGAILSGTVLSNAGRWVEAMQCKWLSGASEDDLRESVAPHHYRVNGKFVKKLRKYGVKLVLLCVFSLAVVFATMAAKIFMTCSKSTEEWNASLNRIYTTLHSFGIAACLLLLLAISLKRSCGHEPGADDTQMADRHAADRLMLWFAVAGVVVYRLQRMWITFITSPHLPNIEGGTSLLNFIQSILQLSVIEGILSGRIRNLNRILANGTAWFMIFLNAAEWFIYATAFGLITGYRNEDSLNLALAIVSMPLHVFFCFHSIGCFYEFKEHMHSRDQHTNAALTTNSTNFNNNQPAVSEEAILPPSTDS